MIPGTAQLRNFPRRAFTLMELVIVLALLSVVAALVAPQLRGFVAGRAAEEEFRRFASLVEYARSRAIGDSARVTLWVADDGKSYGLRGGTARGEERVYLTAEKLTITSIDAEGLALEESRDLVVWPDGVIDAASPASYRVDEDGTEFRVLSLNEAGTRYEVQTP